MIKIYSPYKCALNIALCFSVLFLSACFGGAKPNAKTQDAQIDAVLQGIVDEAELGGHTSQSVSTLEKLYSRNSEDPKIAARYARALRETGESEKARLILEGFVNQGSSVANDAIYVEYATLYLADKNYPNVIKYATKAQKKNPQNALSYQLTGMALAAQGQDPAAELAFKQALQYWDQNKLGDMTPVWNNLALSLASQKKVEDALLAIQKAKALSPKSLEIERNYRIVQAMQRTAGVRGGSAPVRQISSGLPVSSSVKTGVKTTTNMVP
jgi:Flp pilus assembly protein TadD